MLPRRPYGGDNNAAVSYTWPTPDPEGPLVAPLAKLVTLLAATSTFRTRCGLSADDPNGSTKLIDGLGEFQKRIYYPYADFDDIDDYPVALIQWGPAWAAEPSGGGSINYTRPMGVLRLVLVDEDRKSADMELSLRDFGIFVGQLLDDLRSQFAYDAELAANRIRAEQMPAIPPDDIKHGREPFRWETAFLLDWAG